MPFGVSWIVKGGKMDNTEIISENNPPVEINPDPVPDPIPEQQPAPEPAPETSPITNNPDPIPEKTVSDNKEEEKKNAETQEKEVSENTIQTKTIHENNYVYESVNESVEVSTNVVIDPNDLVSVNSISLNVVSADGLSLNSVSVNVSNNYISNNTLQIISADSTPFWNKPFKDYTVSEGLLFIIMVSLVFGFVSTHLLRGLRDYGNF